jgi:hypothetical protein
VGATLRSVPASDELRSRVGSFFYTTWHFVAQLAIYSAVFLCIPSLVRPSWAQFKDQWRLIVTLSALSLTSIACENSALTVVSLTLHESFKSSVPLLTMIFAFLAEGRHYRWPVIASVVFLAVFSALVSIGGTASNSTTNAKVCT